MNKNILNEEYKNFKYLMGYKRGVVLSEQDVPNPLEAQQPTPSNASTIPDKSAIKDVLEKAKEVSRKYKKDARIDSRNKRRQKRSDRKTCDTLRRGIAVVTPTDTQSLTELCPVLFDCIADKNIEATFKFPACDAYKTQAASSTETGGGPDAGTQGTPTADRATETECIKKYKWFIPNNIGMWEQDKISYKGKNAKGEEIIFTYAPSGTYMGDVSNTTTKKVMKWSCGTSAQPAQPTPQEQPSQAQNLMNNPFQSKNTLQSKLGL